MLGLPFGKYTNAFVIVNIYFHKPEWMSDKKLTRGRSEQAVLME